MSRVIRIQNDFTSGELDPRLRARTDLAQYQAGLTTARNVSIQPQGGAVRRPGTKYIATLDSGAADAVRMVSFEFSVSDSYMLVFTPGKMYVFKDGVQITNINGSGNPYATVASLTSAILPEMNWVQSADTLIIVHEDLEPLRLVRGATDATWTVDTVPFSHVPLYAFELDTHNPTYTITPSAASGNITITASSVTTDNGTAQAGSANTITLKSASSFTSDDQPNGMFIEITAGTGAGQTRHVEDYVASTKVATVYPDWDTAPDATSHYDIKAFKEAAVGEYINSLDGFGRARITEFVSATSVKAYVEIPFFDTSAITSGNWESEHGYEEAWSATRGYPRSVVFHEGRLFFGGSKSLPSTLWGSRVSDFFNFDPGEQLDDSSVEATLDTGTFNAIVDIYSGRHLQIFTTGGEFYVPQSLDDPITPANLIVKQQSAYGMRPGIRLQNIDGATLFIQRQGKALQDFVFADVQSAYTSAKVSLLSSHLLRSPSEMATRVSTSTDEGDRLLIVNDDDGSIVCYTLLRSQNVIAPSEWTTDGDFVNVGVDVDSIYTVVKRAVNGADVYLVELFDDAIYLDSAKSGGAASSVTMDHLEGETVQVIRDGVVEAEQTVPSTPFTITFAEAATTSYQAGLNYSTEIKTLPVEPRLQGAVSLRGFKKRIFEVNAEIFETQSMTIGGKEIAFRQFDTDILDAAVPEFTGIKTLHGILGYTYEGQITIGQSVPLKMTVLGIDYKISAGQ
jgi:hypothetical protein